MNDVSAPHHLVMAFNKCILIKNKSNIQGIGWCAPPYNDSQLSPCRISFNRFSNVIISKILDWSRNT